MFFCRTRFHENDFISDKKRPLVDKEASELWQHIPSQVRALYVNFSTVSLSNISNVNGYRCHMSPSFLKNEALMFCVKDEGSIFFRELRAYDTGEKYFLS